MTKIIANRLKISKLLRSKEFTTAQMFNMLSEFKSGLRVIDQESIIYVLSNVIYNPNSDKRCLALFVSMLDNIKHSDLILLAKGHKNYYDRDQQKVIKLLLNLAS